MVYHVLHLREDLALAGDPPRWAGTDEECRRSSDFGLAGLPMPAIFRPSMPTSALTSPNYDGSQS